MSKWQALHPPPGGCLRKLQSSALFVQRRTLGEDGCSAGVDCGDWTLTEGVISRFVYLIHIYYWHERGFLFGLALRQDGLITCREMSDVKVMCVMSGFHREVDENRALLGHYAASSFLWQMRAADTALCCLPQKFIQNSGLKSKVCFIYLTNRQIKFCPKLWRWLKLTLQPLYAWEGIVVPTK